jgi:pSer/pThr/pTyr-binding forkhead associated (FHA) protein
MSVRYSLTIIKGLESGQTFRLDRREATLGRHAGHNDVVLSDPYISSKHARIIYESGKFFLEDLGSTNKTLLNGVALIPDKPMTISDGMEFMLGETRIRFSYNPDLKRPLPMKKVPGENRSSHIIGRINRIIRDFDFDMEKITRFAPIILGIIIWAVVVIVFLIITTV